MSIPVSTTASAISAILATCQSSPPNLLAPPAQPTGGGHRTPEVGATVKFADRLSQSILDARVVKVRPTGTVDLLIYGKNGTPTVFDRVPHSDQPVLGTWSNGWDIPRPPATLDELLAAEEAAGRPALRLGLKVRYIHNSLPMPDSNPFQDLQVRRGRVERIRAIDRADIAIFASESIPLDPDDEDVVQRVIADVRHDPSPGIHPNRFIYASDAWSPPGRARISDVRPRWRCDRCKAPADPGFDAEIPNLRGIRSHLCDGCRDGLVEYLKPIATPIKA